MKRTNFISVDKTLSIVSEQQLKINFSFSMAGCINKHAVSLWDPHLVFYSLMCLCVVLKKGLEQEGKMLAYYRRSVDDTLTVMPNKTCAENILETLNRCHSSVMFTMENESNGYFPSWAPSSSTDHHVWRPKSMLSPRTLAYCCITRATQTLDINGRYQKLYLIVLSDFRPTGRISPKNAIVLNYFFPG